MKVKVNEGETVACGKTYTEGKTFDCEPEVGEHLVKLGVVTEVHAPKKDDTKPPAK